MRRLPIVPGFSMCPLLPHRFSEKVFTFPEYGQFVSREMSIGDMSNFKALKSRLKCAPFASYINRFSYVYLDGGLIPSEVFQLKEETTGFRLERVPQASAPHDTVLVPCAGQDDGGNPGSNAFHLKGYYEGA